MQLSNKQVSVSTDHHEFDWTRNMLTSNNIDQPSNRSSTPMKRPQQPQQSQQSEPLKCPRCDSTNTKFCYYNNYNKTQPRHLCKACKRHWTKGGTLRNVPVGGGRKNKRIKRAKTATTNPGATWPSTSDQGIKLSDQKHIFPHDDHTEFDQVSWDFNSGFTNSSTSMQQNLGFPTHTNLSFIDTNTIPIVSTSFPAMLSGFKDETTLDQATRMMLRDSSNVSQPWLQVPTTSNFLEPSYWVSWNDTDSMGQADLNKPFDDPQMKH